MKRDFVYHATDLYDVPNILRNGLHSGNDGNIWAYEKLSQTLGMMFFMRVKKAGINMMTAAGFAPPRWRAFLEMGYGVIRIDCKCVEEYAQPHLPSTHWCIKSPKIILPKYLTFMGAWDDEKKELRNVDLRPYDMLFQKRLKNLDADGVEVDLSKWKELK